MKAEGRLLEDSESITNFSAPNFRTVMPLPTLLHGLSRLLADLYEPGAYFQRALRSLEVWKPKPSQTEPDTPLWDDLRLLASSMWTQGVKYGYRRAYWGFLGTLVHRYRNTPVKLGMGLRLLVSAHHFLIYAQQVADELERECAKSRAAGNVALTQEPVPTI
jgi:hypothetical protein